MDKRKIEYQKAVHWNVKDLNIFLSPNSMQLLQGTWGQQISFEKKKKRNKPPSPFPRTLSGTEQLKPVLLKTPHYLLELLLNEHW